ncbi:putative bifunctional diguanylate cyclase/phosphodiesterase [Noviherbaspirillum autotrophicum]|uniref:putative bifunctional diguanylate cyclase/phosphodiesterase n=1 Tax=Noviherbaspirillum autotrophicum TaxID=709839 RepID=UPI000694A6E9|nr:EAL domain-containing protein [Noviherbaspirillum autotrophicum]
MEANTVLIITGNDEDALMIEEPLKTARDGPFITDRVHDLAGALDRLRAGDIDIVLVDLFLKDSEGGATFDALFQLKPSVPIMTLCDEENEAASIEAVQHGAQGYLSKGYFSNTLVPQALRNIIQRKKIEEALYVEKERARVTLESIGDGVLSTDVHCNITYLNPEAERMTGWTRDEARGRPIAEIFRLINGDTRQPARNPVEAVIADKKNLALQARSILVRRDGEEAPIEDSAAPIFDRNGEVTGAVVTFRDVTETQAMARKMAHLAEHDYLTGLPNRLLLNDRLSQAIAYATRHGTKLAVFFLDLDNFKHINDSLGHSVGDELLSGVAKRLTSQVRHSDTVSRLGGDEFVVLVLEDTDVEHFPFTAEKILRALAAPHHLSGNELHVTTSIGISLFPDDGADAETLVKNADIAMYHAKKNGRNNFQFFNNRMNARAVARQTTEIGLRRAIECNEFVLHYQPKVDLESGKVTGAEALIRWQHPQHGIVLPESFIAVAVDSGLIIPIGSIVLRKACEQLKKWQEEGMAPVVVSVNVSALEFRDKRFLENVRRQLQETGVAPHLLQLELTEAALMRNIEASTAILRELKQMGMQIAIDDFGTGYSSLSYLSRLPIDVLKIDQSFVKAITGKSGNGVIVSAVIGMGSSLSQRVIAEGVETKEQLDFLHTHHCDEGQGHLFSAAMPADEFGQFFRTANATGVTGLLQ